VRSGERERERKKAGERKCWTGERKQGGLLPPSGSRTAPPCWGCPDWPPAKWRRRAAPATGRRGGGGAAPSTEQGGGLCPPPAETRGLLPPSNRERGGLPPSLATHRGPGGPLAARGRRHSAGGAPNWGGAGHPKKRRGLCPLNKDAQGAGRPPGRVQGRRHGAGGGLPPPGVPEESEGGSGEKVEAGPRGENRKEKEEERKERKKRRKESAGVVGDHSPAMRWLERRRCLGWGISRSKRKKKK